jgi:ATP-dependent protease ClpP protease subunit
MSARSMTYSRVLEETQQGPSTRVNLYKKLESELKKKYVVVSFFMMFGHPRVFLVDKDADMLEEVLQNTDLGNKELLLILNCPGGSGLAAERIISICRSFSPKGYSVIVPKQAKSAATMICLGAKQIFMSPTSELGPIDPQISIGGKFWAAHEIIEAYEDLIKRAVRTKGKIEPFLQQLHRFDARDIRWIRSAQQLAESIAVKALETGMMKGKKQKIIRQKIKPFFNPRYTKVHGRALYHDTATKCGLDVRPFPIRSDTWKTVWELYVRLNYAVSGARGAKIIESAQDHYVVPTPPFPESEKDNED